VKLNLAQPWQQLHATTAEPPHRHREFFFPRARQPPLQQQFLHQSASSSSSRTPITARHNSRTTASQTPFPQPSSQIERDERFHLAPPRTCTAEQRRRRRRRSLPPSRFSRHEGGRRV